jgi:transposase-like protein
MVLEPVPCQNCGRVNVVRYGKTAQKSSVISVKICYVVAVHLSRNIPIRAIYLKLSSALTEMARNGSGMRATARVLKISRATLTQELKKISSSKVNWKRV